MQAPADRQITLRLLAAGGLVAIAVIHLLDLPSKLDETPYLGVPYILRPTATSLLAAALIVGSRRRIGWLLAGAIAVATAVGYSLSRTTGLPNADDDIGNWSEPLGVASLIAEGCVVLPTIGYLAVTRRHATPTRTPAHRLPCRAGFATKDGLACPRLKRPSDRSNFKVLKNQYFDRTSAYY